MSVVLLDGKLALVASWYLSLLPEASDDEDNDGDSDNDDDDEDEDASSSSNDMMTA